MRTKQPAPKRRAPSSPQRTTQDDVEQIFLWYLKHVRTAEAFDLGHPPRRVIACIRRCRFREPDGIYSATTSVPRSGWDMGVVPPDVRDAIVGLVPDHVRAIKAHRVFTKDVLKRMSVDGRRLVKKTQEVTRHTTAIEACFRLMTLPYSIHYRFADLTIGMGALLKAYVEDVAAFVDASRENAFTAGYALALMSTFWALRWDADEDPPEVTHAEAYEARRAKWVLDDVVLAHQRRLFDVDAWPALRPSPDAPRQVSDDELRRFAERCRDWIDVIVHQRYRPGRRGYANARDRFYRLAAEPPAASR